MTASIGGIIKNTQGDPLAGISVKLIHEPTGSAFAKMSNGEGMYQFDGVKAGGPYHLSLTSDDSTDPGCRSITLKIDELFNYDFTI